MAPTSEHYSRGASHTTKSKALSSSLEDQFSFPFTALEDHESLDLSNLFSSFPELDFSAQPSYNQEVSDEFHQYCESPTREGFVLDPTHCRSQDITAHDALFDEVVNLPEDAGISGIDLPELETSVSSSPESSVVSPELTWRQVPPREALEPMDPFSYPTIAGLPMQSPVVVTPEGHDSKLPGPLQFATPTTPGFVVTAEHSGLSQAPLYPREEPFRVEYQRPIPKVVKRTDAKTLARRSRNTEAARRSRLRSKERINELEEMVNRLQVENATLKMKP